MSRLLWLLGSILLAGGLLVAVFSQVDTAGLGAAAQHAHGGWALAVVASFGLNHALRIARWHVLLAPPTPVRRTVAVCLVAFFGITMLPLRIGEVIRPTLHARDGIDVGHTLAAVVVERLFDLLALLALLGLSAALAPPVVLDGDEIGSTARRGVAIAIGVIVAGLVAVIPLGPHLARVPLLGRLAASVSVASTALVRDPRRAAATAALTAATWGSTVLYVWCGLHVVPDLPTTWTAAAVTWAATMAAITVLPTPGFFGSYEAGFVAGLSLLGAPLAAAAAISLGLHLSYVAFSAVLGMPAAWAEGESFVGFARSAG